MSSALLKVYDNFEMANNTPKFSVKKFDVKASFSIPSMICGNCSCDIVFIKSKMEEGKKKYLAIKKKDSFKSDEFSFTYTMLKFDELY